MKILMLAGALALALSCKGAWETEKHEAGILAALCEYVKKAPMVTISITGDSEKDEPVITELQIGDVSGKVLFRVGEFDIHSVRVRYVCPVIKGDARFGIDSFDNSMNFFGNYSVNGVEHSFYSRNRARMCYISLASCKKNEEAL